jgi:hypothetical protein
MKGVNRMGNGIHNPPPVKGQKRLFLGARGIERGISRAVVILAECLLKRTTESRRVRDRTVLVQDERHSIMRPRSASLGRGVPLIRWLLEEIEEAVFIDVEDAETIEFSFQLVRRRSIVSRGFEEPFDMPFVGRTDAPLFLG